MLFLADQPLDAILGIAFLMLLFGGIWAFSYTEKMWLRRGVDTTFESFQISHPSVPVSLRGCVAMLLAYLSCIGPLALIPAGCIELFGKNDFAYAIGTILGVGWLGFIVTIGKAWLFPAIRSLFRIPPRKLTPNTSDSDHEYLQPTKRAS